jgi:transposase-like protein
VDHEGEVLDMLVQRRRDSRAAFRLMRKLLKKQGFVPKLLVTDKLRSYGSSPDADRTRRKQAQASRVDGVLKALFRRAVPTDLFAGFGDAVRSKP